MNDSIYEEYMRSVLGYRPTNYRDTYEMNYGNFDMSNSMMASNIAEMPNMYSMNTMQNNFEMAGFLNMAVNTNMSDEELEKCYPDIYRIIYPMVQKACTQNSKPLTKELIDNMTEEIYFAVEDNEMAETRGGVSSTSKETKTSNSTNAKSEEREDRQRVIRNSTLRDLIRILLLRELLRRQGFPGGRPPHPRPPRPPMRPPMI